MNKKQLIIIAVTGILMFGAGYFTRVLLSQTVQSPSQSAMSEIREGEKTNETTLQTLSEGTYISADVLKIRINDGNVEWYDGLLWHNAASVEELKMEDKFYIAEAEYEEFAEQLKQEENSSLIQNQENISVWQQEKPNSTSPTMNSGSKPGTAAEPKPQTPISVTPPAQGTNPPATGTTSDSSNNSFSDDDSSDDDSSSDNSGGGGDSSDEPAETPPDDSSDTGDGENMEWSDDYL